MTAPARCGPAGRCSPCICGCSRKSPGGLSHRQSCLCSPPLLGIGIENAYQEQATIIFIPFRLKGDALGGRDGREPGTECLSFILFRSKEVDLEKRYCEVTFCFLQIPNITFYGFSQAWAVVRVGVEAAPPSSRARAHWPVIGWLLTILGSDWLLPEV